MSKSKAEIFLEESFLKPLLGQEDVTDISYNGKELYYMSNAFGRQKADIEIDVDAVGDFLRQLANMLEKKWSYSDPLLDVSFGPYRLNAVFSSLARVANKKAYTFSLRIETEQCRLMGDKKFFGNKGEAVLLKAIKDGESIVIGGKTGTGKTELQKWILLHLPSATRVIVIDNVEELDMVSNSEVDMTMWLSGQDEESYARLVKNSLRSNPDYIVLAECRGKETFEALQCAMSGHPIVSTIHARGVEEMPSRLANMAVKAHEGLNKKDIEEDIRDHFRYYVYLERKVVRGAVVRKISKIARCKGKAMEVLYSCAAA